jgi:hypothetical protein
MVVLAEALFAPQPRWVSHTKYAQNWDTSPASRTRCFSTAGLRNWGKQKPPNFRRGVLALYFLSRGGLPRVLVTKCSPLLFFNFLENFNLTLTYVTEKVKLFCDFATKLVRISPILCELESPVGLIHGVTHA